MVVLGVSGPARAQGSQSWTEPFEPFQVTGNLYFAGTQGVSSILFVTPAGDISLDRGVEALVEAGERAYQAQLARERDRER